MSYVLIVISTVTTSGGGVGVMYKSDLVAMQEFVSETRCVAAQELINQQTRAHAFCVVK